MTPGANPPVAAMARAVDLRYPITESVRTAARSTRCLVSRAKSDDLSGPHPGRLEHQVESPRQLGQVMAGHGRVEMVLQMIGELQEERRNDAAAQGSGLRHRGVAEVVVRQIDRQQG